MKILEYKVWYLGTLGTFTAKDADALSAALNALLRQGWTVHTAMPEFILLERRAGPGRPITQKN